MDEGAKLLHGCRLVGLEQRRAGEADEHRTWHQTRHGIVHLAGLAPVCLVDEDKDVALSVEVLRNFSFQSSDELIASRIPFLFVLGTAKLVDERANQPLLRTV